MAPALYMEDRIPGSTIRESYQPQCQNVMVVHGWRDDICPWEGSLKFARDKRSNLHLIDADHRLEEALPTIGQLLREFLRYSITYSYGLDEKKHHLRAECRPWDETASVSSAR